MTERGNKVDLPGPARLLLRGLSYFTWPLRIDDYLELITPLWSVEERRGRIERVHRETDDAVTVFITPGLRWVGHKPGQYVRIGFDVEGKAALARLLLEQRRSAPGRPSDDNRETHR